MEKVNLYDIYRDSEFYKKTYMKRYELSKDKNADVIELKEKRSSLQYSIDAVKSHFSILVFVSFLLVVAACILFPGYSYIIVPVILGTYYAIRGFMNSTFQKAMLSKELMTASIKLISQMYKNEDIMVDNKAMEDFIRSQKV